MCQSVQLIRFSHLDRDQESALGPEEDLDPTLNYNSNLDSDPNAYL